MDSKSSSAEDDADALLYELTWSRSLLWVELALLDGVGDIDCLLPLQFMSNPLKDEGDPPLERDNGRSDREVRRFGGASKEKPGWFDCQPWSFGEDDLWLALTGELPLLPFETGSLELVLILLEAGLGDLRGGVNVLEAGVEDLRDGVAGCKVSGGLHREDEFDDLVLVNTVLLHERGEGLSLLGLALLLLDLRVFSICVKSERRHSHLIGRSCQLKILNTRNLSWGKHSRWMTSKLILA